MTEYIIKTAADKAIVFNALSALPAGTPYRVVVTQYRRSRSSEQNRLFHAWMRDLSDGYEDHYGKRIAPEIWKEYFKQLYLGQDSVEMRSGKVLTYTRGTSGLNVSEMQEFMDKIQMYCAEELGVNLA